MNSMVVVVAGLFAAYVVLPFAIGMLLGKAFPTHGYSFKIGLMLCMIGLGLAPFIEQIVRTEQTAYRRQAEPAGWVSLEQIADGIDTVSKHKVEPVALRSDEVLEQDGKYVLAADPTIVIDQRVTVNFSRWRDLFKTNIDRTGGSILTYALVDKADEPITNDLMDRMLSAVARRVDQGVVRRAAPDRIEVAIPGVNPATVEEVKSLLRRQGRLEFAIVANVVDHKEWLRLARISPDRVVTVDGAVRARWAPVKPDRVNGVDVPNIEFDDPEIAVRQMEGSAPGFIEVLIINEPDADRKITGKLLTRANLTEDERGKPAIGFHFNSRGAALFQQLTTRNRPSMDGRTRRLAILLDDIVMTAPRINSVIGADGIIQGNFTEQEAMGYVSALNAGELPRELEPDPVAQITINPAPGDHERWKAKLTIWFLSLMLVPLMWIYCLWPRTSVANADHPGREP